MVARAYLADVSPLTGRAPASTDHREGSKQEWGLDMTGNTAINHEEAMSRIAMEYIEMPDLKLSSAQARRLWNIPSDVCDRALAALVERGFLVQTRAGAYLRRSSGAPTALSQAS